MLDHTNRPLGKQRQEPPGQNRAKSREKEQLVPQLLSAAAGPTAPSCSARSTSGEHIGEGRARTTGQTAADTAGREPCLITWARTAQKAAERRQPRATAGRTTSLQKKGGTQEHPRSRHRARGHSANPGSSAPSPAEPRQQQQSLMNKHFSERSNPGPSAPSPGAFTGSDSHQATLQGRSSRYSTLAKGRRILTS